MSDDTSSDAPFVGVVAQPALWLPQTAPWALGAMAAAGEALLEGGCPVRVYDGDFAGQHPLAVNLCPRARGGAWGAKASVKGLPWWEVLLSAVARGEHTFIWLGSDNAPPKGWGELALRARDRGVDCYWLPGEFSAGFPADEGRETERTPPIPRIWLGLRSWETSPVPLTVAERWKRGESPIGQRRKEGLWWPHARAKQAAEGFALELDTSMMGM